MGSNTCESIQSQLSRLPKSKATASTTAIQPLEITTTAVVTSNGEGWEGRCDGNGTSEGTTVRPAEEIERRGELQRKQSHHHHHHHIKSPIFEAQNLQFNASVSPLVSPSAQETPSGATDSALSVLPSSPIIKGPSEAIAALQNAVNASKTKGASSEVSSKSLAELFESSFFSAVLLVQWSNVMGPKVERVWSNEPLDERLQQIIGRQVLNGEMGRTLASAEPKWVVLHRQGIVCTAFLYNDSTALCALILVVPVRYLRNFSQYFNVLCTCVPRQLVEPLVKLRKIHRRLAMTWIAALDYFASYRLVPFIRMIMELESVSLPTECVKIGHTILDTESKQMLDSLFIAKVITSHLQTSGSTVLIGNTLTSMNMVINTLALFLSPEERSRSSHAQKNHKYMVNLYLQGILIQDIEHTEPRLSLSVLNSDVPTTLVDMQRLTVKHTPLFPAYQQLQKRYHAWLDAKFEDELAAYVSEQPRSSSSDTHPHWRRHSIFHRSDSIAPMVQNLLDDLRKIPARMREAYIRQWRRWLIRYAVALIKYVDEEIPSGILHASAEHDIIRPIMQALGLNDWIDFSIVLTQAEKLRPGIMEFIHTHGKWQA